MFRVTSLLAAVLLVPLSPSVLAVDPVKDTIKLHRKVKHEKHKVENTIHDTKRTVNELQEGTYVENSVKRKVDDVTDPLEDKVDTVKDLTDPNEMKKRAKDEIKDKEQQAFDDWLYDD
ncbi:hypothetical protein M1D72_18605 [Vibrio sp. AK197]